MTATSSTVAAPLGVVCPKCLSKLTTTRTTRRSDGSTQREKTCRGKGCGYRTLTFERLCQADHRELCDRLTAAAR